MTLKMRLKRRLNQGNFRQISTVKGLIDFASNDYLGLARSSELMKIVEKEWQYCTTSLNGLGSTGSRLLTGNSKYIQDLEKKIAAFHRKQTGVLFNCGYMANLGLMMAVAQENDCIFFDTHVHASMHDGIKLSLAKAIPFRHNDLSHLESQLKIKSCSGQRYICIESLYSTDGSKAPLQEISRLASKYQARLIVDEAHAIGVWGPQGRGIVAEHGLENQIFAHILTFGKALGVYGAMILGSYSLKHALINFSRSFIYTTALPFHVVATIKCSYDLFPQQHQARSDLKYLIRRFRETFDEASETQIQCITVEGNFAVRKVAEFLSKNGFDVRPLMSPTVRRGQECLRICLHAFNTIEQVDSLISQIKKYA